MSMSDYMDICEQLSCERSSLQSEVAELRKERDDLIAAIKKSDDEYLKLEQRLAGQVPSPAAVEPLYSEPKIYGSDEATYCVAQTATIERMEEIILTYCAENPGCGLGEIIADLRLMLITEHSKPAAVGGAPEGWSDHPECESCEAYAKLGGQYAVLESEMADLKSKPAPTLAGVPDEPFGPASAYETAKRHTPGNVKTSASLLIEIIDALRAARPTSEATTQPAADGGGE